MKLLNQAVTLAIFEAENHDREGAKLWDRVADCERAISESDSTLYTDLEKEIAEEGERLAKERARMLRRERTPPEELAMRPCQSTLRYLPDCCCPTCEARRELQDRADVQDLDP